MLQLEKEALNRQLEDMAIWEPPSSDAQHQTKKKLGSLVQKLSKWKW
jgi:hypothetical protein